VPAGDGDGGTRGLLGAVGKKLLKVLVFPLVDPLIQRGAQSLADRWEANKRPYVCRSFTLEDFREAVGSEIDEARWRELSGTRTLLLIHGTFSSTRAGFGGMSRELLHGLHERYEGRVVAFDHPTLSHDPRRNVDELARMLPNGVELDLDVICHSRGGLVARVIAERPPEHSRMRVRRIVFVAAPNAGTVLADGPYMGDLVDRYTTLLNLFPDNGMIDVLQAVITVVKQLAVGALAGLDGLASMRPEGPFLKDWLNDGGDPGADYFALASNYEPTQPGLRAFARDALMDRVFGAAENDLVVPTAGVHAANGSRRFPIAQVELFGAADGIQHSGFFASQRVSERIRAWLT
jgi:pimeloyl-ACP methyl ester carboxylesterase